MIREQTKEYYQHNCGSKQGTNQTEFGYCIGRRWWHRGIVTEALAAVIEYLITEVGMNRVAARHDPNNPHSGGVMRKCGMKYEGTHRACDRNNQGICDAAQYAILRSEWEVPQYLAENVKMRYK